MPTTSRLPTWFIGHGSPMNALEVNRYTGAWAKLGKDLVAAAGKPKAILVVSAHWQTRGTAVTAMAAPRTIHDFGAFPKALFDVRYPAPGSPELAARVRELLAPTPVALDREWGLDHGTWSVLVHAFPEADVPVLQLSMDVHLPHAERVAMGQRLQPLRDEGVLIVATGNVVHNLPAMDWGQPTRVYDWADRFQTVVREAIVADTPQTLVQFSSLGPDAQKSIPSADHYLPLLYLLGTRRPDDAVRFETPDVTYGSLSMLSVVVEPAATAAEPA